ncbi:MAG: hypothetical protein ABIS39_00775 [Sphingomicrobium sp.]
MSLASNAKAQKPVRSGRPELVLQEGNTAKLREATKRDWTKKKETNFLTVLAETCKVTVAAREAGVSAAAVYARRKKNAAFRAAWGEAIAIAYRRLELLLLERAFNGTEKLVTRKDGSEERVREYPNSIALQLFKMHKDTSEAAEREPVPGELEELRAKLQGKIERLRKRLIDDAAGE